MINKITSIFKSKKKVNKQDRRLVYRLISDDVDLTWDNDIEDDEPTFNTSYFTVCNFPINRNAELSLEVCDDKIQKFITRTALCAEEYNVHDKTQKINRISIRMLYSDKPSVLFVIEFLDAKGKSICFVIQIKKDPESFNRYECESTILTAPNKVHSTDVANACLNALKKFIPIKVEHNMFLSNDIVKDMQELLGDYYNKFSLQVVSSQSYTSPLLNKKERHYVKVFGNLSQRIIQNQTKKQTSLQTTP